MWRRVGFLCGVMDVGRGEWEDGGGEGLGWGDGRGDRVEEMGQRP